jgi:Uncharacterized membrane protein (homolog of Drosophila rhomboid)
MNKQNEGPKLTFVTALIVGTCLFVQIFLSLTGMDATNTFGLSSAFFQQDNFLSAASRLVLHAFAHQNLGHLIANMIFLMAFGSVLEYRLGSKRFAILFATGVLVSGFFSLIMHPLSTAVSPAGAYQPVVALIGASGGISAIIAAVLLAAPRETLFAVGKWHVPAWTIAILFFIYQGSQLAQPGAMYDSVGIHMAGALAGFAFIVGMKLRLAIYK